MRGKPRKVLIGGITYSINYGNPKKCKELQGEGCTLLGCVISNRRQIWISSELTGDETKFVLFHEILHAACWCMNKHLKEDFIRPFSHMVWNALVSVKLVV